MLRRIFLKKILSSALLPFFPLQFGNSAIASVTLFRFIQKKDGNFLSAEEFSKILDLNKLKKPIAFHIEEMTKSSKILKIKNHNFKNTHVVEIVFDSKQSLQKHLSFLNSLDAQKQYFKIVDKIVV